MNIESVMQNSYNVLIGLIVREAKVQIENKMYSSMYISTWKILSIYRLKANLNIARHRYVSIHTSICHRCL